MKIMKIEKRLKITVNSTKKFRGAAHSNCNLNDKVPKDIPIIVHNASYDTHFIINQLAEELRRTWLYRRKYGKIYHFFCTN